MPATKKPKLKKTGGGRTGPKARALSIKPSNREPDREPRAQYAALPWRRTAEGAVEVLLITSRETKRWVIPKGWPIVGKTSAKSAAREAFEESGVVGKVAKTPIGAYSYEKRLKSGRLQHVRVTVFALLVDSEVEAYPELGQRDRLWLPPAEAAKLVGEPELMVVIATFQPPAPGASTVGP